MQILLLTFGTRGDVDPYLALALGLQKAGADVRLAVPSEFCEFVNQHGVSSVPLTVSTTKVLRTRLARFALRHNLQMIFLLQMLAMLWRTRSQTLPELLKAGDGADAIVVHAGSMLLEGMLTAEYLGLPLIPSNYFPTERPTSAFPNYLLLTRNWHIKWLNRLSYPLFEWMSWLTRAGIYNGWRKQLRLARWWLPPASAWLRSTDAPLLHGFSPTVLTPPLDWDGANIYTGFWWLPASEDVTNPVINADLQAWLASNPAPIYIGFGSMSALDTRHTLALARAVQQAYQCGVVLGGPLDALAEGEVMPNIFYVTQIDHAWLFPHCRVIVHHGGAGTTYASLYAGKPIIICPIFYDQFFWASQVEALGVGQALPYARLTPQQLVATVAAVQTNETRERGAQVSTRLRAEAGIGLAVKAIMDYLNHAQAAKNTEAP